MKTNNKLLFGALAIATLMLMVASSADGADKWVSVYYESWIKWSPGGMDVDSIDFTTGTHWIWFSSDIASDGSIEPTRAGGTPERLKAFCDSAHAKGRKAILGTGGWGADYTPAANNPKALGHSIAGFMRTAGFDGLDIDWEPVPQAQQSAYVTMCRIVRDSIKSVKPDGVLTVAMFGYDPAHVAAQQYLDQMNCMTYDIAGSWTRMTWHNNPIYDKDYTTPDNVTPGSIDKTINTYINAGVPASKLGIGIDLYTYVWLASDTLASTTFGQVNSNVLYGTVMNTYYKQGKPIYWDSKAKASFFTHPFVSFDSDTAMVDMAAYVKNKGLGGAIVFAYFGGSWSDDPRGERQDGKRQPNLMRAIKYSFGLGGSMPPPYPYVPPPPPPPKSSRWIYYDKVYTSDPWMPWGYAANVTENSQGQVHSGTFAWRCDFQAWSKEGWIHQTTWNVNNSQVYSDSLVFWAYPLTACVLQAEFGGYMINDLTLAKANQWTRYALAVPGPFDTFTFNNYTGNNVSVIFDEIALVMNDSITGVPQPPPPPGAEPPPPPVTKASSNVYDDAIVSPWSNVSSAVYPTFNSTAQVKSGTYSTEVRYLAWGELGFLHGPTWGQETPFASDSLKFDVYPTRAFDLVVAFYGATDTYTFKPPANQWSSYTVPCPIAFDLPITFNRFRFTNYTADTPMVYFDNIRFLANGATPGKLTSHDVNLQEGWNMISSYIQPYDSALSQLCSGILPTMSLMKNSSGQVYWPEYTVNTIGNWNFRSGYQVFMKSAGIMTVTGNQLSPEAVSLPLAKGHNLIAYIRTSPMRVDSALVSVMDTSLVVKNNAGQAFWPLYGINTIGSLKPGQGYKIYRSKEATLSYPANTSPSSSNPPMGKPLSENRSPESQPAHFFHTFRNTGANALVLVESADLRDGDEIAIWSSRNTIVGSAVAQAHKALITVWGHDPLHPSVDGARAGEALHLTVWSPTSQSEQSLPITSVRDFFTGETEGPGILHYATDKAVIASVRLSGNVPTDVALLQNYPNPFNPTTFIEFRLPVASKVTLKIFDILGREVRTLVNDLRSAGENQVEFDATGLASGTYIYRLEAGNNVISKRLVLLK